MTRVAAIDTSTWWGGVALLETRDASSPILVAAEAGLRVRDSHAVHLLALLEALLARAEWSRTSIDAYAASRGPGSFTGIRVGLGTVRGLGLAAGRPCLGVVSLQAMAEAFGPAEAPRSPLLAAGRGEFYGARFDAASSPPRELVAPWLGPPRRALEPSSERLVVFGDGAEVLTASAPRAVRVARAPRCMAAAVGRIALSRLAAGAADGDGLSPLYLRPSDAELNASRG